MIYLLLLFCLYMSLVSKKKKVTLKCKKLNTRVWVMTGPLGVSE